MPNMFTAKAMQKNAGGELSSLFILKASAEGRILICNHVHEDRTSLSPGVAHLTT